MKNNRGRTPERYRNDKPPAPKTNIPVVRTMDGAMSYIAKHRAFTAHSLHWEDKDASGTIIATATYTMCGSHVVNQGITKGYLLQTYNTPENTLFYWVKEVDQWYRNEGNPHAIDHPLEPCVPPEKAIIPLSSPEINYLIRTNVMELMQAKLNGGVNSHVWLTDIHTGRISWDELTWGDGVFKVEIVGSGSGGSGGSGGSKP